MSDDEEEFLRNIRYRGGCGYPRRAIERERIGPNAPGRDPREMLRRMIEQVARECGHPDPEAIEEGAKDAVEGRRPRW